MNDTAAAPTAFPGFGSKPYRAYILGVLVVIYTFNFVDRLLISIAQEAIREDFGISNFYLGLLGGPVFAVLYTALGIPIARLAERANRITIVSIGAFVWSLMTAACGFAANFFQLALCRLGVGIGEAACVPPSQSAIADYFPAERRASAMAIFALGIPLGSAIAYLGGGWIIANYDWRAAFIMLGAPGILAALLLKITVREPPRSGGQIAPPTFGETLKALSGKASFWHVALAGALINFFGYGTTQFLVSHLVRSYEIGATPAQEIANASYAMGVIAIFSTAIGTVLGGQLADRLAQRHARAHAWLPALGAGVAAPLYLLSFLQVEFVWAFAFLALAPIFHYLYIGPMYAVTLGVAQPLQRATAVAILLLVANLIGYGLGPPFVGAVNDWFASQVLASTGTLTLADCNPARVAAENATACAAANATGLKYALCVSVFFLAWAAVHFLLVGRTFLRDRVS